MLLTVAVEPSDLYFLCFFFFFEKGKWTLISVLEVKLYKHLYSQTFYSFIVAVWIILSLMKVE